MNIVVFIKQVPDTNNVKWTEKNNIDRSNMESIMNPVDRQALEAALNLKDLNNDIHTIAITMGPKKSLEILKEAIAMGIDDAYLLCDSKFAGSDTCATSKILSAVITKKFTDTKLILFGQSAIDGETSQTGPSTSARLNIPVLTHVTEILNIDETKVIVNTETEEEKQKSEIILPASLCINNYITEPRIPRINGYIKSQTYNYKSFNIYELNLSENDTGVKGSPTYVSKVYRTDEKRTCRIIEENCSNLLINEIKQLTEN